MSRKNSIEKNKQATPISSNVLIVGALLGAGTGLIAAMLLHRSASNQNRKTLLNTNEIIQVGFLILGLFRAISSLGKE